MCKYTEKAKLIFENYKTSKYASNVSFIGIGVGIRILGEVKGQDFTDDAVSLLLRKGRQ